MENGLKVLAVHHVAENSEEDARVAISPGTVKFIASKDVKVGNRDLKCVTLHFIDSDALSLNISSFDLSTLEEVIAGFSFGQY